MLNRKMFFKSLVGILPGLGVLSSFAREDGSKLIKKNKLAEITITVLGVKNPVKYTYYFGYNDSTKFNHLICAYKNLLMISKKSYGHFNNVIFNIDSFYCDGSKRLLNKVILHLPIEMYNEYLKCQSFALAKYTIKEGLLI